MFTKSFVTTIIEPAASGDPSFVAESMLWVAHLMAQHIAVHNTMFASIQARSPSAACSACRRNHRPEVGLQPEYRFSRHPAGLGMLALPTQVRSHPWRSRSGRAQ